jgi:hypothetical protein
MIEGPSSVDEVPALACPYQDRVGHEPGTRAMARGYGTTVTKETPDARRQTKKPFGELQLCKLFSFLRLASGV